MDKNHQLSRQDASYLTNYLFSVENGVITKRSSLEIAVVFYLQIYYLDMPKRRSKKGSLYSSIPKNRQSLIQILLNSFDYND